MTINLKILREVARTLGVPGALSKMKRDAVLQAILDAIPNATVMALRASAKMLGASVNSKTTKTDAQNAILAALPNEEFPKIEISEAPQATQATQASEAPVVAKIIETGQPITKGELRRERKLLRARCGPPQVRRQESGLIEIRFQKRA